MPYFWMIMCMKKANNFQVALAQAQGVAYSLCLIFASFSLVLLIKVLPIKKACSGKSAKEDFLQKYLTTSTFVCDLSIIVVKILKANNWKLDKAPHQYIFFIYDKSSTCWFWRWGDLTCKSLKRSKSRNYP